MPILDGSSGSFPARPGVLHTGDVADESLYRTLTEPHRSRTDPYLLSPEGPTLGFTTLLQRTDAIAAVLHDRGVRKGDRLVVQLPKTVDAVAVYLAALRLGAIYVPLNPGYTVTEVARVIADAEPALYVGDLTVAVPSMSLAETLDGAATAHEIPPDHSATRDETATMLYTSGTTGRPKGAPASSRGLLANARDLVARWQIRDDDVLLHVLPIFHVHGLFVALHTALLAGARVIFHERFDAAAAVASFPMATVFMGVPTMYARLLVTETLDAAATAGMRLFTSGSAPLPVTVHDEFTRRTGHRIVERYGLTETGIVTSNHIGAERPGAVGTPLDQVEIRLAGPGAPQHGEVEVRGPAVTSGYWRSAEATAATFSADGWFRTGDIGELGGDGELRLLGRSKDIVISGGLNVHPLEVESAILDTGCPEVAVIGLPHPDLGEAVVAVATQPGAPELDQIAPFKRPKAWIVVDALPRNAMGKVEKHVLRDRYADWFS